MALDPASWIDNARTLTQGQRRRFDHDCGSGRTLVADHKPLGYSAYCWRCSDDGWVPHPPPTLAERVARLRGAQEADQEAQALSAPPLPAEHDPSVWPLHARVWLYKAGLSNDRIRELGFYWCERMRRVVMPVLNDRVLSFWQARGFEEGRAKYINPPINPKPVARYGAGPVLVLTEDILSAVRVGEVTQAWSIMGTAISDTTINAIIGMGKPVRVWLDPDKAGERSRRKLVPRLRAYGIDAKAITTAKDPKFHSLEEIRTCLDQWKYF